MPLAIIGIPICYYFKQSHGNDSKSLYSDLLEIVQIATTIFFAKSLAKDAIDRLDNDIVAKRDISSHIKIERTAPNYVAVKLTLLFTFDMLELS